MRKIIVCLIMVSLLGCVDNPKKYSGTITAGVAREHIALSQTAGIVNAVMAALVGLPTIGAVLAYADAEEGSDEEEYYWKTGIWGGVITTIFMAGATENFKTSREWEDELSRVTRALRKTLPYQDFISLSNAGGRR